MSAANSIAATAVGNGLLVQTKVLCFWMNFGHDKKLTIDSKQILMTTHTEYGVLPSTC